MTVCTHSVHMYICTRKYLYNVHIRWQCVACISVFVQCMYKMAVCCVHSTSIGSVQVTCIARE